MTHIQKRIEAHTLQQLIATVDKSAGQGWVPVGQPTKSENGYIQVLQRTCGLC